MKPHLGTISLFFKQFFQAFKISFFQPGSLNGAVRSEPTPLHNEAIFTKSGKIKVSLYSKSLFFELDTQNFGSSIVLGASEYK